MGLRQEISGDPFLLCTLEKNNRVKMTVEQLKMSYTCTGKQTVIHVAALQKT